jgi:hypothetical protein
MRLVHKSQYIIGRCILYYFENAYLTKCKTYVHAPYKPRIGRGKTLIAHRKLRYFLITPRLQVIHISKDYRAHNMASFIWYNGWSYDAPFRWCMEAF